jgi:hypothetical protein
MSRFFRVILRAVRQRLKAAPLQALRASNNLCGLCGLVVHDFCLSGLRGLFVKEFELRAASENRTLLSARLES